MRSEIQIAKRFQDPLRRSTATPLKTDLSVMGRKVRLETNSRVLFAQILELFEPVEASPLTPSEFLWRFVSETSPGLQPPWPLMTAFSDDGLRYVNLGQRSFFAVDLEAREAIAFLPEDLCKDKGGVSSVFASTLFDLTAAALRLVQISAACVALHGKALLIFGPPKSGKTTSTYLAGKLGLEFYADEASFLDLGPEGLLVWGQFWPAAFRRDTAEHLPELASSTYSFTYGSLTFFCLKKPPFPPLPARPVTPIGCIFLERQAAKSPQLISVSPVELEHRLHDALTFIEDDRFGSQCNAALQALGELPAYRLAYGDDPGEAARLYPGLIDKLTCSENNPPSSA